MNQIEERAVLEVKNLSKVYEKGQSGEKHMVLDNVSFELYEGEILGVIGANGAGKSTLLKILSEITAPTSGDIMHRGKLVSILDIGTGFHPDLSGTENIFLKGSILGYSKEEIEIVYPKIIEFSGLKDYIDMPLKQFSSGMYLRLAFAVAFGFDMDILVLDEVISVGDAEFRAKCYNEMRNLISSGKTIIMVSHDLTQLAELCSRCIWLDKGQMNLVGQPEEVVSAYLAMYMVENNKSTKTPLELENLILESINISSENETIDVSTPFSISILIEKKIDSGSFQVHLALYNLHGVRLLSDSASLRSNKHEIMPKGKYLFTCEIPGAWLSKGVYKVGLSIIQNFKDVIFEADDVSNFKVSVDELNQINSLNKMSGSLHPVLNWKMEMK